MMGFVHFSSGCAGCGSRASARLYANRKVGVHARRWLVAAALFLFALAASGGRPARAAKFFHGDPRQIRACVLTLPSTARNSDNRFYPNGQIVNPYVFFALDQRTDLRPDSWEFVN